MSQNIDLMVFTCEGREKLLKETMKSFFNAIKDFRFRKVILCIDGNYNLTDIDLSNFDLIIHERERSGYVQNIQNALNNINSDFIFWLEDDWMFNTNISLEKHLEKINMHQDIFQIALSKHIEKIHFFEENYAVNPYGFTANPCLCRTNLLKNAFQFFVENRNTIKNFEEGIGSFVSKLAKTNLLVHNNNGLPLVEHLGYLETTDRKFHAINSEIVKEEKINALLKVKQSLKIFYVMPIIAVKLFFYPKFYDLAFRVYNVFKLTSKYH